MTSTDVISEMTADAIERELRASIAATPADFLVRIGLDTAEKIEAYIAAEVADVA